MRQHVHWRQSSIREWALQRNSKNNQDIVIARKIPLRDALMRVIQMAKGPETLRKATEMANDEATSELKR